MSRIQSRKSAISAANSTPNTDSVETSTEAGPPDRGRGVEGVSAGMTFEAAATAVLGRLQSALSELLKSVPSPTRTASEVERAFGIDYKLSWQVHKIATAQNPLAAGSHVPAKVSIEKLLKAATRRGVSKQVTGAVQEAFGQFEQLSLSEAEDREELTGMLAALVPEVREKREVEVKRAAFKAMSQIKGVSLEAQVGAFILHPSKDGSAVDRATFSAYVGLRRLRAAAYIGFGTLSASSPNSTALTLDGHRPDGLNSILLPQYCSEPTPRFAVQPFNGWTFYSVTGAHVGLRSAIDLVMAELRPGAMRRYRQADGRIQSGVMNLPDLPMKRQTTDVFVHRDIYPNSPPGIAVYDTVPRGLASGLDDPAREPDRIPFAEQIRPISGGLRHAAVGHLPRYVDMLEHVCGKLGWDPAAFRGYRLDVAYPVYGAQYMIGFALPDAPQ